jgi:predicted DNA-binding ribbon-helix-helix protein
MKKPKVVTRQELVQEYTPQTPAPLAIERVQLGIRMEKRLVKVLKALAEACDMTLTEILEDIVLHALEGHSTFNTPEVLEMVKDFKRLYGMNYSVHDNYRFTRDA